MRKVVRFVHYPTDMQVVCLSTHVRRPPSYNARHLAQEDKLKGTKTKEELENTKSTIRFVAVRYLYDDR